MAGKKAPRLEGLQLRGTRPGLRADAGGPQRGEPRSDGAGVAEVVRRIGLHNHLCVIYETQEERFAATVPFLQAGLERGEKCLYVAAEDNTAAAVLEATKAQGVNVDAAIKSGTLTVNTQNETYLKRGHFDPEEMIRFLAESTSAAKAGGYPAFRLAGEMTWIMGADGSERWAEYESKLNHFLRDCDVSAICLYDHRRFSPEVILGVLRTHPTVVYGGLVSKNPYYVPPDEFLKPNQPALEVQRLLNHLRNSRRAEGALRESEQRFRQLAENIREVFWMDDPKAERLLYVSPAYEQVWGRSCESLYQELRSFLDSVHPDDRPRVVAAFDDQVQNQRPFQQEYRIVRPDGSIRWIWDRGFPVRNDKGEVYRLVGIAEDITERKQAEDALRQSEDRYRDLVEHSQDLICTHNLEGKLLSVNRAATKLLGYEPDELLRKPLPELLAPEVRDKFADYISAISRDGVAQGLMLILTRSGERRIWAYNNSLRVEGIPEPVVRGMAHDVTDRQRAEMTIKSLMRISEKLNSTLDIHTLMDSLVIEAMMLTDSEIGWSGLRTERGMVCTSCVRDREVVLFEYCWPPGVGWPGWVLAHKVPYVSNDAQADSVIVPEIRERFGVKSGIDTPILDAQGEVIGFFGVNNKRDGARFTKSDLEKQVAVSRVASIALQNAMSFRKLRETQESLRQLSARLLLAQEEERRRIARELHDTTAQILAALAINLGVVKESSPGLKPKASKALAESFALVEKCVRETRTISYLMHPPMLEEIGLQAALRWYTEGFTKRSGVRVKLEMPRKLGDVSNGVALALYRVVQESLTNIHRHSGSRTATLRLVREPHRIILSVADQGCGMKPEVVDSAWGQAGPAESAPGVGIQGMRERVRQLGGQLQVQSGQRGTTVTVELPLREES